MEIKPKKYIHWVHKSVSSASSFTEVINCPFLPNKVKLKAMTYVPATGSGGCFHIRTDLIRYANYLLASQIGSSTYNIAWATGLDIEYDCNGVINNPVNFEIYGPTGALLVINGAMIMCLEFSE